MLKKLRIKLIAVSAISLLIVLVIIIGTVNIVNYIRVIQNADTILDILADNGGTFMREEEYPEELEDYLPALSPELPYESRYFSVLLTSEGAVISLDTERIAAIDAAAAAEYASAIWEQGGTAGFAGNYRYITRDTGDGIQIIFLDCTRSLETFSSFLVTSCVISFFGLAAVLMLLILLSGRIIKPVSESYEKQKQFITDAGHEIKTPLTIIDADADILEMEFGENEWIRDIQNQTRRLTALTGDLIHLSRMEESGNRVRMIRFPLSDVAEELVQSFQALAKTKNKTFQALIQPMISICGDEKSLRRLISILLDNALKYSNEGGTITLKLEKQGRTVKLTVANTTERIEQEKLPYLFERFYRMDPSRNSGTGGYGIGLSIAKAVVTAHKGRISASSPDGYSLIITAALPA